MLKTHEYRMYPNKTQEKELMCWMRIMCDVYCILTDYKSRLWESSGRHASQKDLYEMFQSIRPLQPEIKDVAQALFYVMVRYRIMPAYRSFFATLQ